MSCLNQRVHGLVQVIEELGLTVQAEVTDSPDGKDLDVDGEVRALENDIQKSHYSLSKWLGIVLKSCNDILDDTYCQSPAA